jgi:hypothetical protein
MGLGSPRPAAALRRGAPAYAQQRTRKAAARPTTARPPERTIAA